MIDGQQRITALTAAVVGQSVLNKDYKHTRIKIAYNPQATSSENKFEVCNTAIERNPIWISDIAPILNGTVKPSEIRKAYVAKNPNADEDVIEEQITALQAIAKRQIGAIELNQDLDIDTVTDIFIRINQKGVVLSNADFVMSKIASDQQYGGNQLRKMIDYFCHLQNDSSFLHSIEENDKDFAQSNDFHKIKWISKGDELYTPNYIDVLRVAFTYSFGRGKFSDLVALLSGRDFENRRNLAEIAEQSYQKLRVGLETFFHQTHYERFLMLVRSAGFINKKLLGSQTSLNIAYAIYLQLKSANINEMEIQRLVKKWLVMSILTGRYSGSSESSIERDMKQIREKGLNEYLQQIELAELNDGFWGHGLVNQLDSSSTQTGAYLCYLAAQCKNQDAAFLSDSVKVVDLLLHRGDEHHIFPKNYLMQMGYKRSEYNQIANFVLTEQQTNIRLSDKSPELYWQEVLQDMEQQTKKYTSMTSVEQLADNLGVHCMPESFYTLSYEDFLLERRKLMAEKIKQFYFKL